MQGRKKMKGIFKSYDENTGKGTIAPEDDGNFSSFESVGGRGPQNIHEVSVEEKVMQLAREDEYYYFNVPQEHAHKMNIKLGASVEFDLVKEGEREVTHLRF
jgi:cold shock CspA family protein